MQSNSKKNLASSTSLKSSKSQVRRLSDNLFSKLKQLQSVSAYPDSLQEFTMQLQPNNTSNSNEIQSILSKASIATKNNQQKISKARKSMKRLSGCFLTGTDIVEKQRQKQMENVSTRYGSQEPQKLSHADLIKGLMDYEPLDDLSELRKMLKETGSNIQSYRKKVYQTQKDITNYANGLFFKGKQPQTVNSMNQLLLKYR